MGFKDVSSALGLNEFNDLNIVKAVVAEFMGVMFVCFVGCGSCLEGWATDHKPSHVQIALAFGITVATMVQCTCHISGGHINPAVTIPMLLMGRCSLIRAVLYIGAQLCGGMFGSWLLREVTPHESHATLGLTDLAHHIRPMTGFLIEFLITFVLVAVVFAVTDANRTDVKGSAPLAIGLAVTANALFAIKYTGASMNSARTFGPAVVTGIWDHHWVYWCGPVFGGIAAGLLYTFALSAPVVEEEEPNLLAKYRRNDYDRAPHNEGMP